MSCNQCSDNNIAQTEVQSPLIQKHHDIDHYHDPEARRSKRVEKAGCSLGIAGDSDVWVEKLRQNTKTGKLKRVFESTNTGRKCRNEPPTGASHVVYLKIAFVDSVASRTVAFI